MFFEIIAIITQSFGAIVGLYGIAAKDTEKRFRPLFVAWLLGCIISLKIILTGM